MQISKMVSNVEYSEVVFYQALLKIESLMLWSYRLQSTEHMCKEDVTFAPPASTGVSETVVELSAVKGPL